MKLYLRRADWTGERGTDRPSPAGNLQLSECHLGRFPVDDIWVEYSFLLEIGLCKIKVVECRWRCDDMSREEKEEGRKRRGKGKKTERNGEKEKSSYSTAGTRQYEGVTDADPEGAPIGARRSQFFLQEGGGLHFLLCYDLFLAGESQSAAVWAHRILLCPMKSLQWTQLAITTIRLLALLYVTMCISYGWHTRQYLYAAIQISSRNHQVYGTDREHCRH